MLLATGVAWVAQGQTTVFDDSAASYSAGDLAGQNNWTELLNYDTNGNLVVGSEQLGYNAFDVDNSSWIDTAGTDADFLTTTNGSFVYLDEVVSNDEDLQWTYTMDFNMSMPDGGAGGVDMPNAEFFYIGLTSETNSGLNKFQTDDVCFILRLRAEAGRMDVQFQNGNDQSLRLLRINPTDLGWAPEATDISNNPVTADYQTDDLRLVLNLRKSRTDGTFIASGLFTNLTSGFSTTGDGHAGTSNVVVSSAFATNAYSAAQIYVGMGRSDQAYNSAIGGLFDIDIDALNVSTQSVPPEIAAPQNVIAVPSDSQVSLSWDSVDEVDSYNILRSTTMGSGHVVITNVSASPFLDTSVVNDTTYYYIVQADFGAAGSSNSLEASATPSVLYTGTLIDTDFSGYSNGDLAGQDLWVQVSGSSNNAFNVINSGTSTAAIDTVSTTASFSTNVGNAVYLNKLTDNAVYDAWEGHIDFVVSAVSNSPAQLINNQDVLVFGITADPTAPLFLESDDNMALMSVKVRNTGKLVAMFAEEGNDTSEADRLAVLTGDSETGWDPDGQTDMESDLIRYTWKIRKSGVDGTYQAFGSFSNLTAAITGSTQFGGPYLTAVKQGLYDNASAKFAMGHYYKSRLDPTKELVNVTVYDISVTHTTNNLPELTPPVVTTEGSDRTVTVNWGDTFEATDYDVLFAETSGGSQTSLANTTGLTHVDTPRFNEVTNWYTVRAHFPSGTADSTEVFGLPTATTKKLQWGPSTDLTTGFTTFDISNFATNSGIHTVVADTGSAAFLTSGSYSGPNIYGVLQGNLDSLSGAGANAIDPRLANNLVNGAFTLDCLDWRVNGTGEAGCGMLYIESTDWDVPGSFDAVAGTAKLTIGNQLLAPNNMNLRAAIRNGSTWYVSQTLISGNGGDGTPLVVNDIGSESWAEITLADLSSTALMEDPTTFTTTNNAAFTNINAVGFFCGGSLSGLRWRINEFQLVVSGGSPASTQYWMNQYGSVSDLASDTDGDSLINLKEYAFGGNPEDENDQGTLPNYTQGTYGGTNGFFVAHVELRDPSPGIDYGLKSTEDLVFGPAATNAYPVVGEANIDYYFKAVTNFVPTDAAAKFLELLVTEQ